MCGAVARGVWGFNSYFILIFQVYIIIQNKINVSNDKSVSYNFDFQLYCQKQRREQEKIRYL